MMRMLRVFYEAPVDLKRLVSMCAIVVQSLAAKDELNILCFGSVEDAGESVLFDGEQ